MHYGEKRTRDGGERRKANGLFASHSLMGWPAGLRALAGKRAKWAMLSWHIGEANVQVGIFEVARNDVEVFKRKPLINYQRRGRLAFLWKVTERIRFLLRFQFCCFSSKVSSRRRDVSSGEKANGLVFFVFLVFSHQNAVKNPNQTHLK
jgi:hypothetical protein